MKKNNLFCISKNLVKLVLIFIVIIASTLFIFRYFFQQPQNSRAYFPLKIVNKPINITHSTCIGGARCQLTKLNVSNFFSTVDCATVTMDNIDKCTTKVDYNYVKNNYMNDIAYIIYKNQNFISTQSYRILNSIPMTFNAYFYPTEKEVIVKSNNVSRTYVIKIYYHTFNDAANLAGYEFSHLYTYVNDDKFYLDIDFVFPQPNNSIKAAVISAVLHEFKHGIDTYQEATKNQKLPPDGFYELNNLYYGELFRYLAKKSGYGDESNSKLLSDFGIILSNTIYYLDSNNINNSGTPIFNYLNDLIYRYIYLSYQRYNLVIPENKKTLINKIESDWYQFPLSVGSADFNTLKQIKSKGFTAVDFFPVSKLCFSYASSSLCRQKCSQEHKINSSESFSCKPPTYEPTNSKNCCPL